MTLEEQNKVEQLFKDYSNLTSLAEGHYDYLIDREDFIEVINEFLTWQNANK